jgi:guanine nucleotide-binding protein alpha-1 subunit
MDCASGLSKKGRSREEAQPHSPDINPFTLARLPIPPNETEEERATRVRIMQEAQDVSRQIDDSILESKKLMDKRKKATKILLLGAYMNIRWTSH